MIHSEDSTLELWMTRSEDIRIFMEFPGIINNLPKYIESDVRKFKINAAKWFLDFPPIILVTICDFKKLERPNNTELNRLSLLSTLRLFICTGPVSYAFSKKCLLIQWFLKMIRHHLRGPYRLVLKCKQLSPKRGKFWFFFWWYNDKMHFTENRSKN